jgi:UDP-2,4-diacetamido-2,4,6-trideoxy-beta-L-altropyranose hydrolase
VIAIRCDSSYQIGTGHVFRCLALAEKLRLLGHEVVFISRNDPGSVLTRVRENNFSVIDLSGCVSPTDEIGRIKEISPAWVILDHYERGLDYEIELSKFAKVMVIDDLMTRHHKCDVLLDQNFRRNLEVAYEQLVPSSCKRLLGPQFALLPSKIDAAHLKEKDGRSHPRKVLVFFGGADPTNELLKFYQSLIQIPRECEFHLVATASHQHYSTLTKLSCPKGVVFHFSPNNWYELLSNSHLYFGSSGSVTWERFYLGLPGPVVCIADNQIQIAEELAGAGYLKYYGFYTDVAYGKIIPELEAAVMNVDLCVEMSRRVQGLVRMISSATLKEIFG